MSDKNQDSCTEENIARNIILLSGEIFIENKGNTDVKVCVKKAEYFFKSVMEYASLLDSGSNSDLSADVSASVIEMAEELYVKEKGNIEPKICIKKAERFIKNFT